MLKKSSTTTFVLLKVCCCVRFIFISEFVLPTTDVQKSSSGSMGMKSKFKESEKKPLILVRFAGTTKRKADSVLANKEIDGFIIGGVDGNANNPPTFNCTSRAGKNFFKLIPV